MAVDYVPYTGPLVDRQYAIQNGLNRYFTGKPCKHGHIAERMTGNSACRECHKKVSLNYCRSNKIKSRQSYLDNKEKIDAYQVQYRKDNWHKLAEYNRQWRKDNPWKYREAGARRKAAKLKATPAWCDMEAVAFIYKSCPEGFHVDHIIPLQSKIACGLHIPANLRHLPAKENEIKNKFMPPENEQIDYSAIGWL